jgi:hypothetical protein
VSKIIVLAVATATTLAAIAPTIADSQFSTECRAEMDRLAKVEVATRNTADTYKLFVEKFPAALPDHEAEDNRHLSRFDGEKIMTLSGIVKEFQWSNPRAQIMLTVSNDEGQTDQQWAIEMNGPSGLAPLGWRPKTLTPGMAITVTIHPMRDGTNGGQFMTATLPDGRQMDGGRPATLKNLLQNLRDQAAQAAGAADRTVKEFESKKRQCQ